MAFRPSLRGISSVVSAKKSQVQTPSFSKPSVTKTMKTATINPNANKSLSLAPISSTSNSMGFSAPPPVAPSNYSSFSNSQQSSQQTLKQ